MKRKIVLSIIVALLLSACSRKTPERPNILWVVSEDNTVLLGCYGDENARTPVLDKLSAEGIQYNNAYSNAPVCAPARYTIITGTYASSYGTTNMRSAIPIPDSVRFFPQLLRKAGYYCSNNSKEDYNTIYDSKTIWDESSGKATWENRKKDQPFFSVFNFNITHEHVLFESDSSTITDQAKIKLPPYHPDTKTFRHDWAQYYDRLETMDMQIGELLKKLKEQGLYENTIIFYYGDNGGILPGSKRFINEPGTHIPMIVRIPEKFKYLFKEKRRTKSGRLVSFVDLAPTVLSLAGVEIPDYMQGAAFLGSQSGKPKEYAFMYRQRMDERYDFVRALRDRRYRYVRNFMPFLPRGQHIEYLWRIPSMEQWHEMFKAGKLDDIQSKFFEPRVCEELYDMENDSYEIINLADNPDYQNVLKRMRMATDSVMIETEDLGFLPEPELIDIGKTEPPYEAVRKDENYDARKFLDVLSVVNQCDEINIAKLKNYLEDENYIVRFWAANGALALRTPQLKDDLDRALDDVSESVRIIAAESLFNLGEKEKSIFVLKEALKNENDAVRLMAVNSIERLGSGAKLFKDELKKSLSDDNKDVEKVARWTLTKIDIK